MSINFKYKNIIEILGVVGSFATILLFFTNIFSWSFGLGLTDSLNLSSSLITFTDSFGYFSSLSIEYSAAYLLVLGIGALTSLLSKKRIGSSLLPRTYLIIIAISAIILILSTFNLAIDATNNVSLLYDVLSRLTFFTSTFIFGKLITENLEIKSKVTLVFFIVTVNSFSIKLSSYLYGFDTGNRLIEKQIYISENTPNATAKFPIVAIVSKTALALRTKSSTLNHSFFYQSTDSSFVRLLFEINNEKFFVESYKNERRTISVQNDLIEQIIYE